MKVRVASVWPLSVLMVAAGAFVPAGAPNNYKLNGVLAMSGDGDVADYAVSLDGSLVVYRADQAVDEVFELYSVPFDGSSTAVKLSATLPSGGDVSTAFEISPDGGRVVYVADQDTDGVAELYSAPSDGSQPPTKLNDPLVPGGGVSSQQGAGRAFRISPDSTQVVYRADQDTAGVVELYVVPIDGSTAATKLNGGGSVQVFHLSPDGSRVAYAADQDTPGVVELYSVPIDASLAPVKLNPSLVAGGQVQLEDYPEPLQFAISADGLRVVYTADQDTDEVIELYSVPTDASQGAVKLNGNLVGGGDVDGFRISADGGQVVYYADQDTLDVRELYSAPIDGSQAAVRLNDALVSGGDVFTFTVSADSSSVVYRADQETDTVSELFSVPIDASQGSTKLNAALVPHGNVLAFAISPDSSTVVYSADQRRDGRYEIFSVPIHGGTAPVLVHDRMVRGGDEYGFAISADSSTVVYLADQDTVGMRELYSAPIDGSQGSRKLSGTLSYDSDVIDFEPGPDGLRVAYRVKQYGGGSNVFVEELFAAPIDASQAPVKLNDTLEPATLRGDVVHYRVSPDSNWVVYEADQDRWNVLELYSVPLDWGQTAIKLNDPLAPGGALRDYYWAIAPDSSRVVYMAEQEALGVQELYVVPIDRSLAPLRLNAKLAEGGGVGMFEISPDGNRVAYLTGYPSVALPSPRLRDAEPIPTGGLYSVPIDRSEHPVPLVLGVGVRTFRITVGGWVVYTATALDDPAFTVELFSVPIDGSAGPVKLTPLQAFADVWGFRISPDGSRVVYYADQEVDDRDELYSVPVDGSGSPIKLNGTLVSGGDVDDYFVISPDGGRVVYRADQDVDDVWALYSVPIDASQGAIPLNDPEQGEVFAGFEITPDSGRVVYRATLGQHELYVVPIDASQPPLKLNGTLVAGGNVGSGGVNDASFSISPAGDLVFYEADQEIDGLWELYSVPIDRNREPRQLNATLGSGGSVLQHRISPDGSRVIYTVREDSGSPDELYGVPVDRSREPFKLNGPLVPGGEVGSERLGLQISPDSSRVLYLADQDTDEVIELYATELTMLLRGLTPAHGPFAGGNTVHVSGARFTQGTTAEFDGVAALSVTYVSPTELRVVVPAHAPPATRLAGAVEARPLTTTVDVTVIDGAASETLTGGYVYGPLDLGENRSRTPGG